MTKKRVTSRATTGQGKTNGAQRSSERSSRVKPVVDGSDGSSRSVMPIVGIGASAGGLDALTRLLSHLPNDTGLAYVIVQHLDPVHESALAEILGRGAGIPVVVATDGVRLEANHVYVIPPNAGMTVMDGHLKVVERQRERGVHTVIDAFFESLAEVHGSDAVAVVLSGSGSDGARGVEAIKEHGGITLAQDSASAQFASMPERAIATGCIDFVLPPEGIAERLAFIARHSPQRDGSAASVPDDEAAEQKILFMLRRKLNVDFRQYRRGTVRRRILRRMLVHRIESHQEYLEFISAHHEELDALCADLLIGVTRFFRDPDVFAALRDAGFPEMMKQRTADDPVRAWVAGCSTGEETYSVAIMLLEYLGATARTLEMKVFGSDLSEAAIRRARAGLYPHSIEDDVSEERLRRFFVKEDAGYRVTRQLRDMCVFATHNLVRDPPFSQLDLITCRNVFIYFEPSLQKRVLPVFQYALKPGGLLVLGAAESIPADHGEFTAFDKARRIYKPLPRLNRGIDRAFYSPGIAADDEPHRERPTERTASNTLRDTADRIVLKRFGPPGVVINATNEITQFRGDTSAYVRHEAGTASLNILKSIRAEFLPTLRSALEHAAVHEAPVRKDNVVLRDGDTLRHVGLEVIPFQGAPGEDRHYLVLFDAAAQPVLQTAGEAAVQGTKRRTRAANDAQLELTEAREALADSRRYLTDIAEQYEAANEELRAANEEIQSSNEELQSTNEELETTKEEVQSANEELMTVNEEMRHRNQELELVSADLANVFAGMQVPMLMVDSQLLLRRFTPAIDRVMKLLPTDVGRPLGDVRLRFDVADLEAIAAATIETLDIRQMDIRDDAGGWWALTVRPYLTRERKVDGATLVFTDIDAAKRYGEEAERTSETRRVLLLEAETARAEASAANGAKMLFLANMSHDLRTPLNAISGYADILSLGVHGSLTPEQEKDIARIKRSARHLLSLINDILNYAKLGTGKLDIRLAPVAVDDALHDLQEIIGAQVRAKGLQLDLSPCDAAVIADPDKLQQILLNLTMNAIKFTEAGNIEVSCDADEALVRMVVRDTGVGIGTEHLEQIFEPFIQVNRSTTNVNHDGIGLGLAISRDLARAMGGNIQVASRLGEGSAFTLTLPRSMS